ncbi:hypothetical protein C823_002055 [Eubacterium plexicaudatum ASF492]|uniref:Uncharacterized protein n=1 Tax=Eubacterium plexicaudatum ASF492 TaxID=1235802 RepID=N2BLB8_9FIRM|nr:hypothetical protein C823_002055 [Eubacterium plexicaudatum ASF492]
MIEKNNTIRNERLLYLINTYTPTIKSKSAFARLLYDKFGEMLGFSEKRKLNKKYNYTAPDNYLYKKDVECVLKEIENDLQAPDCSNAKGKYIKAYCLLFNCSADYLLGFIDLPTHEKTDFGKLTGLLDNCIDTLSDCTKHKVFDNSHAEYNQNITMLLNYLLYRGKDKKTNYEKISFMNDIFNYLVFSDFNSFIDNSGKLQGSHITFTDNDGRALCSLPVASMYNAIKLNINSSLDILKNHIKISGFYTLQKPLLQDLLNEIKGNQDKIEGYNNELSEILNNSNPVEKENYIGTLERCKGMCFENINQAEMRIISTYLDILYEKDFSELEEWQRNILKKIYKDNEWAIKSAYEYHND